MTSSKCGRSSPEARPAVIDNIPAEILVEIFLIIFEISADFEKPSVTTTLIAVCKYFNEVVKSVPMLWTSLVIPPLNQRHKNVNHLQTCFSYSRGLPLNVIVRLAPSEPAFGRRKLFQRHLQPFWPDLKRCHALDIHAVQAWKEFTSLFPPELPELTTLRLTWPTSVRHETSTAMRTTFPKLRKLYVDGHLLEWSVLSTRELTDLELSNCTLYDDRGWEWLNYLRSSTRLETLRLIRVWNNGRIPALNPVLSLVFLHLKRLEILDVVWIHISSMLRLIAAPYLEELRIHGHTLRNIRQGDPALRFPCLTRLWIQVDEYPVGHIDDLLERLEATISNLTQLCLSFTSLPTATATLSEVAARVLSKANQLSIVAFRGICLDSIASVCLNNSRIKTVVLHTDLIVILGARSPDRFTSIAEELGRISGRVSVRLFGVGNLNLIRAREAISGMNGNLESIFEDVLTEDELVHEWRKSQG